jgi:hypothetical protein
MTKPQLTSAETCFVAEVHVASGSQSRLKQSTIVVAVAVAVAAKPFPKSTFMLVG